MFMEAFQALLERSCSTTQVRQVEESGTCDGLWGALAESGFLELFAPESRGGAGLGWVDAFPVLSLLGRFAIPAPVAQTMVSRLLVAESAPGALVTITSSPMTGGEGTIAIAQVPHGMQATHVICETAAGVVEMLPLEGASRTPTGIHASSVAATVSWPARPAGSPLPSLPAPVAWISASVHAALLSGALERVLAISLQYAEDRMQFGKPIGKFQAVQQQMAVMAEHVAAARVAAQLPFAHGCRLGSVAVAKARCSEAASLVASAAHAVHGAMGVTSEYDLQLYTRRLHEWRMTDGAEYFWWERLGRELLRGEAIGFAGFARSLETGSH